MNIPDQSIPDNTINTSEYTLITFLPLNLLLQLTKMANLYFIVIAILECIKSISTTNGEPTILLPLSTVISLSMIKDFFEDYKRWKSDKEEN